MFIPAAYQYRYRYQNQPQTSSMGQAVEPSRIFLYLNSKPLKQTYFNDTGRDI